MVSGGCARVQKRGQWQYGTKDERVSKPKCTTFKVKSLINKCATLRAMPTQEWTAINRFASKMKQGTTRREVKAPLARMQPSHGMRAARIGESAFSQPSEGRQGTGRCHLRPGDLFSHSDPHIPSLSQNDDGRHMCGHSVIVGDKCVHQKSAVHFADIMRIVHMGIRTNQINLR